MTAFPSPRQLPWRRLLPFAQRLDVPTIAPLLLRTTDVISNQKTHEARADADLCLRPPIDAFGVLDLERIEQIVEAGHRHAKERVEAPRGDPSLASIFPRG
jgi:predicted acylesterase/phospholipase RssA